MPRAGSEFEVRFDPAGVRDLVRDLRDLAGGKKILARLRRNLRLAAEPIKEQVKRNAGWSGRIPGAVAIGTSFTAKNTGVFIRVNASKAPHARPYEFGSQGNGSSLRHPVFGNTDVWVSQRTRPFFFTETAKHLPAVDAAANAAIQGAARQAGFR